MKKQNFKQPITVAICVADHFRTSDCADMLEPLGNSRYRHIPTGLILEYVPPLGGIAYIMSHFERDITKWPKPDARLLQDAKVFSMKVPRGNPYGGDLHPGDYDFRTSDDFARVTSMIEHEFVQVVTYKYETMFEYLARSQVECGLVRLPYSNYEFNFLRARLNEREKEIKQHERLVNTIFARMHQPGWRGVFGPIVLFLLHKVFDCEVEYSSSKKTAFLVDLEEWEPRTEAEAAS